MKYEIGQQFIWTSDDKRRWLITIAAVKDEDSYYISWINLQDNSRNNNLVSDFATEKEIDDYCKPATVFEML